MRGGASAEGVWPDAAGRHGKAFPFRIVVAKIGGYDLRLQTMAARVCVPKSALALPQSGRHATGKSIFTYLV